MYKTLENYNDTKQIIFKNSNDDDMKIENFVYDNGGSTTTDSNPLFHYDSESSSDSQTEYYTENWNERKKWKRQKQKKGGGRVRKHVDKRQHRDMRQHRIIKQTPRGCPKPQHPEIVKYCDKARETLRAIDGFSVAPQPKSGGGTQLIAGSCVRTRRTGNWQRPLAINWMTVGVRK